jgi:hypothetical protein
MTNWSNPPGLADYGANATNQLVAEAKEAELRGRGRKHYGRPPEDERPGRMKRVLRRLVGR